MSKPAYKPFKSWWVYRDGKPWSNTDTRARARWDVYWDLKHCPDYKYTIVRVLVTPHPPRRASKIKPTLDKGWRG